MRRFFSFFFHALGVIFFLLICGGVYLWYADPFGVRPLIEVLTGNAKELSTEVVSGVEERVNDEERPIIETLSDNAKEISSDVVSGVEEKVTEDKHPELSAGEERSLELMGIDPAVVPTEFTPEQETCFTEVLGEARVSEIKAGDTPSVAEVIRAKKCVE